MGAVVKGWLTDRSRAEVMTTLAFLPLMLGLLAFLIILLGGWLGR